MRAWALLLCFASGCNPPCKAGAAAPLPITEARGRELAPQVATGLALSTTAISGDCRPKAVDPMAAPKACGTADLDCAHRRAPLLVQVIPVNKSVPVAPSCSGDLAVADVAAVAVATATASEGGETVIAVAAGRYALVLSEDGRCAVCGIVGNGEVCLVDVIDGHLTPRDLVIDRSSR